MKAMRLSPRGLVVGWLIHQPGDRGSREACIKAHDGKGVTIAELQQAIEELREDGSIKIHDGVMQLDAARVFGGDDPEAAE